MGVQSVDWYDIIDADADAATLFDILRTPTPTSAGWPLDMTSLRDMETQYLTQAGTNRLFIPRPFVASPMYNALGTP